jgi:hypothetical protein
VKPGDLVELPDGSVGYFQRRLPDGSLVVLVEVVVPKAKKVKEV